MANEVKEALKEALLSKYERLSNIIFEDPESDEAKTAGKEMNALLKDMQVFVEKENDFAVKQQQVEFSKYHEEQMFKLEEDKLVEHRVNEDRRNETSLQVEAEKQKLNWWKVALEMGKVIVPAVISGFVYFRAQRNVLEFEENGRITSTAGRGLGLPKIFK